MDMRGVEPTRPLVVVEGRPRAMGALVATVLDGVLADARADGWSVLRGWAAPMRRDRLVCTGWIRTSDDARRALLAAVSGAGLAVGISADRETIDRFLDDLRRLGPVEHVVPRAVSHEAARRRAVGGAPAAAWLDPRQRAVLALVSEGLTVGEAADELGIAPRAAGRELAAARRAIGVDATPATIRGGLTARR